MILVCAFSSCRPRRWCSSKPAAGRGLWVFGVSLVAALVTAVGSGVPAEAVEWVFNTAEDGQQVGQLSMLNAEEVAFTTSAGEVTVAATAVRAIEPVEKPQPGVFAARLWLTDGSLLAATELQLAGPEFVLRQGTNELRLPQAAVARVAWSLEGDAESVVSSVPPVWQSVVPASAESDLIVIRKSVDPEPVYQAVPCAILEIDAEAVTVALDEDRIPVKRERVAGLVWLRADKESDIPGPVVDLVGGRVLAREVRYLSENDSIELVTDWSASLVVPAAAVRRIDLAAGRTVSLATLPTEDISVAPFFSGLAGVDELAAAFQPRMVAAGERGPGGLSGPLIVARPRTVLRWKMPAGVRQLRMTALAERSQTGGADVVVVVDGEELLRRTLSPAAEEGEVIDLAVAGGRRLELHVDFPAAASGGLQGLGRVRLLDPRLEK